MGGAISSVKNSFSKMLFSSDNIRSVTFENLEIEIIHGPLNDYENYKNILDKCSIAKQICKQIISSKEVITPDVVNNAFELAKDIKTSLESVNQISEIISNEIFIEDLTNINQGIESLKDYKFTNYLNDFTTFYQKVFNTLKSILEFLQKNSPNPGLMNSTTILCCVLENHVKEIQLNNENADYLLSITKLINDGRIILFNEYNRCVKEHKSMIIEEQQKFIFQPKLSWQFNEDLYDKWNDITLSCVSAWYDVDNNILNKDILRKYVETKYMRYVGFYLFIL